MSTSATCSVANNLLTVTNPFGASGSYTAGGAALSFIFSTGGTNPDKACDAGNFIVRTYAIVNSINYPIDYYEFDPAVDSSTKFTSYKPTAALLAAEVAISDSDKVSSKTGTTYTFTITPKSDIPI